jgi:CRISPR-associated protein Csm5
MKYRLTALSPLLVGDGQKLSPIDYMVWKDQVNVLDQTRIFRLLAKGPRLENYLQQIKRADKLDFASWGGFAQNFADRRIPFEHASSSAYWEQARVESLHIPTFCAGPSGPFLPGSALKGALRTSLAFTRWNAGVVREIGSRMSGEKPVRHPGEAAELMTLGPSGSDPLKAISAGDSAPIATSAFRIYLLRVSTLDSRTPGKFELGWKQTNTRTTVPAGKPDQATPIFAEMAAPGTEFTGDFHETLFGKEPGLNRALRWGDSVNVAAFLKAANEHARQLITLQQQYAESAGLARLKENLTALASKLDGIDASAGSCILNLGWGGGFLSKAAFLDTSAEDYRNVLRQVSFYERAIRSGLPFPKTRRIVFLQNQPAALPGWALLQVQ